MGVETTTPAADKAYFDKAMAKAGAEPAPAAVAEKPKAKMVAPEVIWAEGKKAKEAAAIRAAPAPAPKLEEKSEPEAESEEAPEATEPNEREKHEQILRKFGYRNKHFATMDDHEVASKASRLSKRDEADAEAHRLAKEYRQQQAEKAKAEKSTPDSQPKPKPLDLDPITGPLAKALLLDEEGAKTLKNGFEQFADVLTKSTVAPLRDELSAEKSARIEREQRAELEMIETAQAEVGKSFPDLMDPDTFSQVLDEVRVLVNSKKYQRIATPQGRVNACFQDACHNLGLSPEESAGKVQPEPDAERRERQNARPTVGSRARPVPTTQREKDWDAYVKASEAHGLM